MQRCVASAQGGMSHRLKLGGATMRPLSRIPGTAFTSGGWSRYERVSSGERPARPSANGGRNDWAPIQGVPYKSVGVPSSGFSTRCNLRSTRRPGQMDRTHDGSLGGGTGPGETDRGVEALTPERTEAPALAPVATVAGGIPAIVSALKHALGEAGPLRGARLL